jgi:ribosomal protein S12 methylthiotransferase accessory factor
MEALELWHAERLDHVPQMSLSIREMRYESPVPLSSLRWSSGARYLEALAIPWVRVASLTGSRDGWLPRQMLELNFELGGPLSPRLFNLTSSGLASGNCTEEALLHSLCELVERHGVRRAADMPSAARVVDPQSIRADFCREQVERVRRAGMKLAMFDVTWEASIPVMTASLVGPDLPQVWRGSGCHPSPSIALSRAITEAAQSRLTYISGARDDVFELAGHRPSDTAFDSFVEPEGNVWLDDVQDVSSEDIGSDLDRVVAALERLEYDVYYVDLTRPEYQIPVVMSFVPGLEDVTHG